MGQSSCSQGRASFIRAKTRKIYFGDLVKRPCCPQTHPHSSARGHQQCLRKGMVMVLHQHLQPMGDLWRVPEARQACAGGLPSPGSLPRHTGLGWCWWEGTSCSPAGYRTAGDQFGSCPERPSKATRDRKSVV